MATLRKDTYATQIHPETKEGIATCRLEKGLKYTVVELKTGALGHKWQIINVHGFLYRIKG